MYKAKKNIVFPGLDTPAHADEAAQPATVTTKKVAAAPTSSATGASATNATSAEISAMT